ncbi:MULTISPECIES: LPS translocon maturation chaperone LptM [unclassified Xanthobacter]|uniref:LPS translocon maturation chaperone LptM n=1 Tax=unclassified Xanthobacter TaxID=2623496 RepID=UPI001EDD71B0|nr:MULTISPECIES: lipoprotein [unclassified Xanthobacter]
MSRLSLPLALVAALALAGCGVKGPLEPPPGAPKAEAPKTPPAVPPPTAAGETGFHSATSASDMANSVTPHADWEKSKQKQSGKTDQLEGVARPDRPFFLDGLL